VDGPADKTALEHASVLMSGFYARRRQTMAGQVGATKPPLQGSGAASPPLMKG